MNLPGKNQVKDLREDSRVDIVETFLTRKFSYFASVNDIKEGKTLCSRAMNGTKQPVVGKFATHSQRFSRVDGVVDVHNGATQWSVVYKRRVDVQSWHPNTSW